MNKSLQVILGVICMWNSFGLQVKVAAARRKGSHFVWRISVMLKMLTRLIAFWHRKRRK